MKALTPQELNVLHLTLKKQWFDMIASGEKKEEYREIKLYWIKRLIDKNLFDSVPDFMDWLENPPHGVTLGLVCNNFNWVQFRNGYSKDASCMLRHFAGLEIREGNPEWGAEPGVKYFVIKLGERIK